MNRAWRTCGTIRNYLIFVSSEPQKLKGKSVEVKVLKEMMAEKKMMAKFIKRCKCIDKGNWENSNLNKPYEIHIKPQLNQICVYVSKQKKHPENKSEMRPMRWYL